MTMASYKAKRGAESVASPMGENIKTNTRGKFHKPI